ncbi:hypothetical protein halTADL_1577 [Halohasta litchfieldiae]|nr:hypothetical protein halTADL_1577 [Halohasta litchfieldiae]
MTIVMNNLPIGNLIIICCLGIDMLKSIIRTFVPNSSKSSVEDQPEDSSRSTNTSKIGCVGQKMNSRLGVTDPPSQQMRSDGGVQSETAPQVANQQSPVGTQQSSQPQSARADSDKVVIERDRLEELQTSTHELTAAAEQIAESTDEISGVASEQANNMTEVADEASDLSATIEELAAANEEQTAEVTEIAQLVDTFSDDWDTEFEASQ